VATRLDVKGQLARHENDHVLTRERAIRLPNTVVLAVPWETGSSRIGAPDLQASDQRGIDSPRKVFSKPYALAFCGWVWRR